MPSDSLSPWKRFVTKWQNCSACELCNVRKNIVLAKGKIPCDVLFVGEAPGQSEDVHGIPFVGPAGHMLDDQIHEALVNSDRTELRLAFTNLVCCIPKEGGQKTGEPSEECIDACAGRLDQFIALCKPRVIVAVGDLSKKYLAELANIDITHPAAILRAEYVRRALMYQKVVVTLENEFRDL